MSPEQLCCQKVYSCQNDLLIASVSTVCQNSANKQSGVRLTKGMSFI